VLRLAVRVQRAQAELVLAELLDLAPGGVEEVSLGDVVEYAVYGPRGELPELPELRAAAGGALVEVSTTEVADDWAERWREFHQPLVLGDRLTVRAPWHDAASTPIELVIDPGRAFGTGAHATTRLCLEALLELPVKRRLVDLGCGSGVLAIAAAKLGWSDVVALDNDPLAVAATRENAERNQVVLQVRRHDLRRDQVPAADTVAANLLAPLLRTWGARLRELPGEQRPATILASGLLVGEADAVAGGFAGYTQASRSELGEWAALVLVRRRGGSGADSA
jgi:ribosomal protein L11 methyltransferase